MLAALLLTASGVLAHSGAGAEVFRCVDGEGKSLYTNQPCPSSSRTVAVMTPERICGSADCLERRQRDYEEALERARLERAQLEALNAEQYRRRYEESLQTLEAVLRTRQAFVPPGPPPEYEAASYIYAPAWGCVGPRCSRPPHPSHRPVHPIAAPRSGQRQGRRGLDRDDFAPRTSATMTRP